VVAANLFLIFPNDVFSGWGGSGRLIVHTKAVVPVCVVDKAALVGFVERTKHSFHISCVLVSRCSGGRGKEVFGEVAALAALLSLCRLSCLLLPLPLSFLLCNLLLARNS